MKEFPKDFYWGASTSAFQVEGAYLENGKKLSIADVRSQRNVNHYLTTEVSVDHYHHWREDVALMKEQGLKSYRFSVAWARIFPNGDEEKPNEKGLKFYSDLVDELLAAKIEPMITLYHFDQPYGLIEKYGGWVDRTSIDDFVKYAKVMIDTFADRVKMWFTINEQAVMVLVPDMLGISAQQQKEQLRLSYQANLNMWLAQAKVYEYVNQYYPTLKIGPAISYITTLPASMSAQDMMAAKELEDFYSFSMMEVALKGRIPQYFFNEIKRGEIDLVITDEDCQLLSRGIANFIGVNWYCTTIVKAKESQEQDFIYQRIERIKNPQLKHTDWGWNFDPVGLRYGLRQLMDRYGDIPIVITECGWSQREALVDGSVDDQDRISYLYEHIKQMQLAIEDGVNVISFSPWSYLDLLSVGDGMLKRYGMVYVNRTNDDQKDLKRYKKKSYYFYQKVIENNGLSDL